MIRYTSYRYKNETIFPESAIPADIKRQNYSVLPRTWYFDTLKTCRDCGRNFLFFAEEQKYWYERLGFAIDADCVRCPQCRKTDQTLRRRFKRYSQLIARKNLDAETLAVLVADACFLWEQGILKNADNLRRLKNLARRQILEEKATQSIITLVEKLPRQSEKHA
jgi:Probable zinc-ribbon domain